VSGKFPTVTSGVKPLSVWLSVKIWMFDSLSPLLLLKAIITVPTLVVSATPLSLDWSVRQTVASDAVIVRARHKSNEAINVAEILFIIRQCLLK